MTTTLLSRTRRWLPLAVVSAAALLGACSRQTDSAGNAPANDASRPMAQAGNEVRQETREAGQAVADTAKDIAITAEVKTLLARDDQLSALKIDVDTNAGQVKLQGTAPSDAASTRATELARGVDGVQGVDNKLQVARN